MTNKETPQIILPYGLRESSFFISKERTSHGEGSKREKQLEDVLHYKGKLRKENVCLKMASFGIKFVHINSPKLLQRFPVFYRTTRIAPKQSFIFFFCCVKWRWRCPLPPPFKWWYLGNQNTHWGSAGGKTTRLQNFSVQTFIGREGRSQETRRASS